MKRLLSVVLAFALITATLPTLAHANALERQTVKTAGDQILEKTTVHVPVIVNVLAQGVDTYQYRTYETPNYSDGSSDWGGFASMALWLIVGYYAEHFQQLQNCETILQMWMTAGDTYGYNSNDAKSIATTYMIGGVDTGGSCGYIIQY